MIKYGLKLWTSNEDLFDAATASYNARDFDFIELYYNIDQPLNFDQLEKISKLPINMHVPNSLGFDKFIIKGPELSVWQKIVSLSDLFRSEFIIVHPGYGHTVVTFRANLKMIDDPRILIENMPGLDASGQPMYAARMSELVDIKKVKDICYDFEKAVKAAAYQGLDYKAYIAESLLELKPKYFHISGGDSSSPKDEHSDLWESGIDYLWIKQKLSDLATAQDIFLVFEVPKKDGLLNDLKNIKYFKSL